MQKTLWKAILLISCYLGLNGEYLALWKTDIPSTCITFPYHANLYTEEDRNALKKGIPVTDIHDLAELFEDYFS